MRSAARSVLLGLTWVLLAASPASAHGAGGGEGSGIADQRAIAVALGFAAVSAVVGPALVRTAPVGRWRDVVARAAGLGAASVGPAIGMARPAEVLAFGAAAAGAVAPRGSRWRAAPALVVLALVTGGAKGSVDWSGRTLGGVHVVAAACWVGVVLEVARAWFTSSGSGRATARRAGPPALALLVVVATSGSLIAADHLGDAHLALGSWWGRGLALKVFLVASAATIGATVRRPWGPRTEASLLVAVASIGLALAVVGGPLAGAAPLGPYLAADGGAAVVVAPLLPGVNAVLVHTAPGDRAPALLVDGHQVALAGDGHGTWSATVQLPAGRHRLELGARRTSLSVRRADVATTVTADLPARADAACVDRIAGAMAAVAERNGSRPVARLDVRQRAGACAIAGREAPVTAWSDVVDAALGALRARGSSGTPIVVTDGDARGGQLAAHLRRAGTGTTVAAITAVPTSVPPDRPVVVATSRAGALGAVRAATTATGGTAPVVLAPWLLDAGVLAAVADAGLPISADGFEAYLAVAARLAGDAVPATDPGLYGLSRVSILPQSLEQGHESEAGWARGVALVRVA